MLASTSCVCSSSGRAPQQESLFAVRANFRARPAPALAVEASGSGRHGGSPSGGAGGAGGSGASGAGKRGRGVRKARQPGMFEVKDMSPPPRSLGIHALPVNTGNGDWVEVGEATYVVQSVVLQYKLVRGRYERDHQRLEVQQTGRFLTEMFLERVLQMDAPPPDERGQE